MKWSRIKYQPCVPLGADGKLLTSSKEHIELSRQAAAEGMVLLKNQNETLPFKKGTRVALFGIGQVDYVQGGGGSGEVYCKYTRNIFEGFKIKQEKNKVTVFDELSEFYINDYNRQLVENLKDSNSMGAAFIQGRLLEPIVSKDLVKKATLFTDTAVICIRRFSAEASDRKGVKGDFYLSDDESRLVETVKNNFKNVIVVLNVGGMVDTEWFIDDPKISSVLLAWQGGMEGGLAVADILCGDVNPSGKLTDTFAKKFEYYPSSEHFNDSNDYVDYNEDIYVGYRYFETIPEAYKRVNYPFGYGLSYTAFDIHSAVAFTDEENITVTCKVTNIGKTAGKEVVQVYYSAPQGKLGKPAKQLIGFKKTKLLAVGETETVTVKFKINDMASFDDIGKVQMSAYILEKGEYKFFVGNSVRNVIETEFSYKQKSNKIVEQLVQMCAPYNIKRRMNQKGEYDYLPSYNKKDNLYTAKENTAIAPPETKSIYSVISGEITLDEFMAQMSVEELVELCSEQMVVGIANTGSFGGFGKYGIPNMGTVDGPAGVRAWAISGNPAINGVKDIENTVKLFTTCWPCANLMACTWNEDLIYNVARAGGFEVKENNVAVWLTPGMNIHRNPLCGRNFEYFSEDPFLTGKVGSAVVRGVQSVGVAATPKHFCCNNKEENRVDSDSRVSERALREIYLKGFEIVVKEADPWVIMTSYNLLNGIRTSENYELITGILRGEWGFKGVVTSDWGTKSEQYKDIKAGNDINMYNSNREGVLKAYKEGIISKAEIEACAKRVVELALKLD